VGIARAFHVCLLGRQDGYSHLQGNNLFDTSHSGDEDATRMLMEVTHRPRANERLYGRHYALLASLCCSIHLVFRSDDIL
jgi:hypothetical protein